MARLWARTTSYESVSVGDSLPILVKWETAETIVRFADQLAPEPAESEEETAPSDTGTEMEAEIEGETRSVMAPPQALVSYVTELLEKGFPLTRIMAEGSSLELQSLAPVRAEDTISLSGAVVDKREAGGHRLVECRVTVENQDSQRVAEATAVISL